MTDWCQLQEVTTVLSSLSAKKRNPHKERNPGKPQARQRAGFSWAPESVMAYKFSMAAWQAFKSSGQGGLDQSCLIHTSCIIFYDDKLLM